MQKTILFIIDGLPGGGAERVILTLAGEMATRGHNVTIAALSPQCDYAMPPGVHYLLIEDRYRGPLRRQTEIRRRAIQQILAQRPVIDLAHLQQFALASVVDQYLSLITS